MQENYSIIHLYIFLSNTHDIDGFHVVPVDYVLLLLNIEGPISGCKHIIMKTPQL